jgi:hypothetical protein
VDDIFVDPKNKLGADIDWLEDEDEFVRALNNGSTQLGGASSVAGPSESGEPREASPIDIVELRAILARYQ